MDGNEVGGREREEGRVSLVTCQFNCEGALVHKV